MHRDCRTTHTTTNCPDAIYWAVSHAPVEYQTAVACMEAHVAEIARGRASELVWLLEHPSIYTAGTSARDEDLLSPRRFPVYRTGRGGQFTYHGPGQRVAYIMLDLRRRGRDVRAFVERLESWIIETLAHFNIQGQKRDGRVGVWVTRPQLGECHEDKIAAIGVRVRQWVTFHGISINVDLNLAHFTGIVPCGVREHGVTSLVDLGYPITMSELDMAMRSAFEAQFGPTSHVSLDDIDALYAIRRTSKPTGTQPPS